MQNSITPTSLYTNLHSWSIPSLGKVIIGYVCACDHRHRTNTSVNSTFYFIYSVRLNWIEHLYCGYSPILSSALILYNKNVMIMGVNLLIIKKKREKRRKIIHFRAKPILTSQKDRCKIMSHDDAYLVHKFWIFI